MLIGKAKGERRQITCRRIAAIQLRIGIISKHIEILAHRESERKKREQWAEEACHWQSFERLRRDPNEENAKAAKRSFLYLAKRHHPDAGGSHDGFLNVKNAYD
jgi:hypothetical protein